MFNFKLLILLLGISVLSYSEAEPETETETEPEPETTTVNPVTTTTPRDCNIYYRNYQWALQDCVCRCFQNGCLMDIENTRRVKDGETPLVPVSEELCKNFISKKCSVGFPVVAEFPIPAPCGCNRKPGSIATERFYSLCHLLKFSSENRKPFLSYSYCWPI
ncbi:salivary glue protein Sgs-5 [Drosophila eugracilis]|uniref:salivary glue protein Sgs-5 n=1 Tax=Drosophila eugracilis TaxID=29029 RepID=UPI001BD9C026|nr:salivary glue protein Sgs-5 [Drosophila eugracilis]